MDNPTQPDDIKKLLIAEARQAGFDTVRVTSADLAPETAAHFQTFLKAERYGDMIWMRDHAERRAHPKNMWPEAKSAILLGMNYGPGEDPMDALQETERGVISCYARGKDYHTIIKKSLKRLAGWFHRETGAEVKVFVDTAPLMEKPLAERAGLGWQGKHTNLVSRDFGSWLFLGVILTDVELIPDEGGEDHCGSCQNCIDICPTKAFPKPYQLDARRCISYLTIEHQGHIDEEFRAPMGNRIFGCDDCLAVCPWNKYAQVASEQRFMARAETDNPPLEELLQLDESAFKARFKGTPVKRTGRDRFLRNVLIAAGNSGDARLIPRLVPLIETSLSDPSELVRAMAVWALSQLLDPNEFKKYRRKFEPLEKDTYVKAEWEQTSDR